ncbi:hypothetical protein ACFLW3_01560 [Chloroflexota bacterium]
MLSLIIGLLGGMSAIMGVVTQVLEIPEFAELPELFWFVLAVILLLGSIAVSVGSTRGEYE